ncbi:MAG: DNA (cytosine-5-)-methyltransferase [Flavobacterium sp.]|nr:DNA (cytosine-5-)-methyltransferase [Flavobacterium sp.]
MHRRSIELQNLVEPQKPSFCQTRVTGSTGLNVLSLFDGMSCGQLALQRAGIKVNQYFASEIKPHAIKVTQLNFPNTIQLGSVLDVKASDLPRIDLLIGGSPCQDFSSANKEKLGLQGEKSGLFYEYLRLLKECKPKYFLLENVAMDDYSYAAISEMLGTYPTNINSELVSGQLRQRSYWTNIGPESFDLFGNRYSMIPQPRNKKITFQSLLENGYTDRLKARCILESESRPLVSKEKLYRRYNELGFINIVFDNPQCEYNENIRILTQTELERLQTVPEGYTSILKRNDAACLLGDGWTVDTIAHIFSFLEVECSNLAQS